MSADYQLIQTTFSPYLVKPKFHFTLNQYKRFTKLRTDFEEQLKEEERLNKLIRENLQKVNYNS